MNKNFLYSTLIIILNIFNLFAQDDLNGGPPQSPIDQVIPLFFLLTIAVVFVYMHRKNKMILNNPKK